MRWFHEHEFDCVGVNPTVSPPPAREGQRMDLPLLDHAQLQLAVKRGSGYRLPILHGPVCNELANRALRFIKIPSTGASKWTLAAITINRDLCFSYLTRNSLASPSNSSFSPVINGISKRLRPRSILCCGIPATRRCFFNRVVHIVGKSFPLRIKSVHCLARSLDRSLDI